MSHFCRKFCTQTKTPLQNPQTFKTLIANLSKERNLSKLIENFKELSDSKRFRGRHRIYDDTIRRLASAKNFAGIEQILEHQKKYEDITDEGFAVRLVSLYGKAGMLNHASKLFDEMPQLKCERTVKSFNALLQACVQCKQFSTVEKLFRELPSSMSVTPDARSYNIVMQALCEMKSLDSAELILGEMESNGFQPSLITFNILMNGFYLDGRFLDGERIWDKMEKSGIAVDVVSFNAKLQGFLHWGKISEAVGLLEEMISKGLKPDVITYNTLIRWCCNDGDLDKAKSIHERMVKYGCVPNRTTFQALIPLLCNNGNFDLALKLCEESQSLYIKLDAGILQTVVNGLVKDSKVEKAENFVNLVKLKSDGRLKLRMPGNVE